METSTKNPAYQRNGMTATFDSQHLPYFRAYDFRELADELERFYARFWSEPEAGVDWFTECDDENRYVMDFFKSCRVLRLACKCGAPMHYYEGHVYEYEDGAVDSEPESFRCYECEPFQQDGEKKLFRSVD